VVCSVPRPAVARDPQVRVRVRVRVRDRVRVRVGVIASRGGARPTGAPTSFPGLYPYP